MASRVAEVHQVPQRSMLASISLVLSLFIGLIAVGSALGSRWGIFHFRVGFLLVRLCVYGAIISGVMSLVALWITLPFRSNTRGFTLSVLACLISAVVVAVPLNTWRKMNQFPSIHDVSTSPGTPPKFMVIQHFRPTSSNSITPIKSDQVDLQREFYPFLEPLTLSAPYEVCVKRSLQVVRKMDWTIRAANWERGHIEATDTTFWFGFKDDVAIRITREGENKCEVNLRSVSRVGKGDAGRNAERIRTFMNRFKRK